MCGRFAIAYTMGLFARFGVKGDLPKIEPRFNIAPTQLAPIVLENGERRAVMMRWGLVPFWAKDPKIGNRLKNARAETVSTKPAFRASLKKRRCIVPLTGFYEWKRDGKQKTPFYVHMKDDSFFGLAGLYDNWRRPDESSMQSFTIVTTRPNSLLENIHNRMPVIIREEQEDDWLGGSELSPKALASFFKPFPPRPMAAYEVSKDVNSPVNDSPELIKPL
jgi:putative SOS response-associated peptidase YedK